MLSVLAEMKSLDTIILLPTHHEAVALEIYLDLPARQLVPDVIRASLSACELRIKMLLGNPFGYSRWDLRRLIRIFHLIGILRIPDFC